MRTDLDAQAMQQALGCLKALHTHDCKEEDLRDAAIAALQSRLAAPVGDVVAWADQHDIDREGHDFWVSRQQPARNGVPLYTHPAPDAVRRETVEACAKVCLQIWRNAPNDRESGFRQNEISHGCLASAAAIRAMLKGE